MSPLREGSLTTRRSMRSRVNGGVCHAQWLETPRPRGPHPLAYIVREWWKVRAAKAVKQLTNDLGPGEDNG